VYLSRPVRQPKALGGFGQLDIEIDPTLIREQWRAVEPEITRWAREVLQPSISDGFTTGMSSLVPELKKELAPQASLPYLIIFGVWAAGLLAGVWIVARNTGRK